MHSYHLQRRAGRSAGVYGQNAFDSVQAAVSITSCRGTFFFKRHQFVVNEEGLAQHYGLRTEILDLTSNLDVAIFFAICKYNSKTDIYDYFREDGKAVL